MPRLTVWSIRAALLYLLVGFTFGQLMLYNKGTTINGALWRVLPAHIEFLLVGWIGQLALATAHWIIPRFRGGVYGNLKLAWLSIILLNSGILMAGLGPVLNTPRWVVLAGRIAEAAAVLVFAIYIWPRIRPLGQEP